MIAICDPPRIISHRKFEILTPIWLVAIIHYKAITSFWFYTDNKLINLHVI